MRDSVRATFVEFSGKFEGVIKKPYVDILNLVTVAIGNLIDASPSPTPWKPAVGLPFVRDDGLLASPADITAAWMAVKNSPMILVDDGKGGKKQMRAAAHYGWMYAAKMAGNNISLTDAGIQEVVFERLDSNESILSRRYADWNDWPADAQLATHSMSWAMGANFQHEFPHLESALQGKDWDTAAIECKMNETGNAGLKPRNLANKVLYSNASRVQAYGLDPELHWPTALSDDLPGA